MNKRSICGKTEDGKIIIGGAFKFIDTHGLPLAVIMDQLRSSDMGFCVMCFIRDAEKAGWRPDKIKSTLVEGFMDMPHDTKPDHTEIIKMIDYTLTHPEYNH